MKEEGWRQEMMRYREGKETGGREGEKERGKKCLCDNRPDVSHLTS